MRLSRHPKSKEKDRLKRMDSDLAAYKTNLGAAQNTRKDLSNDLAQLSKAINVVEQLSCQCDLTGYHQINGKWCIEFSSFGASCG